MGFFKEIGTFFSKTVPNVVTKEVPKFVTKTVPNVVTKEIPKFVTKTIPSVFERDTYAPDLPPLRKEVAQLETKMKTTRERLFSKTAQVGEARIRYRDLSEDYERRFGPLRMKATIRQSPKAFGATDKKSAAARDREQVARMASTIATLGLAELGFMHVDNANERKSLTKKRKALQHLISGYQAETKMLEAEHAEIKDALAEIDKALTAQGVKDTRHAASTLTEAHVKEQARRDLAARLLSDGVPINSIAVVTGLTADQITVLAQDTRPVPVAAPAAALHPEKG